MRLEALCAERDAVDPVREQQLRELRRDRLRVRLDGRLRRGRQRSEEPRESGGLRERGRAAAEEDGLNVGCERVALELQLREQRVDVRAVLGAAAGEGDEVAVAAAVGAERQVDVQVPRAAPLGFVAFRSTPLRGVREAPYRNAM